MTARADGAGERKGRRGFLPAAVAAGVVAFVTMRSGGALRAEGANDHSSDTAYARELLRLNQMAVLQATAAENKGTPLGEMYEAQWVFANWDDIKKSRSKLEEWTPKYMADMTGYLDAKPGDVDGRWALEEAKFIFADLSELLINRMEYWGGSGKDREALRPMSQLADRLLKVSQEQLAQTLKLMESDTERRKYPNDDAYSAAYMAVYNAKADADYNAAYGEYYDAMAMSPNDGARRPLLLKTADDLRHWIEEADETGVKFQSLLLRGKAYSEAGKINEAVSDFVGAAKATDTAGQNLGWVRYQARYQIVVARMRGGDYKKANDDLGTLRQWIASQGAAPEAEASVDMLAYRVAWSRAQTLSGKEKEDAEGAALEILSGIIAKNPRFKELVFEQLASQAGDNEKASELMPLPALALAWEEARVGDNPPAQMRKSLNRALDAAQSVRENKLATPAEVNEATLIKAVCSARLDNLRDAAELNLEFADRAGGDSRAKEAVELALEQIGKLREGGINTPEIQALTERGLNLATEKFHDKRWLYARGVALLAEGKTGEARGVFEQIAPSDPTYLDAHYQLVLVSVRETEQLAQSGAALADQKAAAARLLKACGNYLKMLNEASPVAKKRLLPTLVDLRLIQVNTAISPLDDADTALQGLDALEKEARENNIVLTPGQRAGILRYRIIAYSKLGDSAHVAQALQQLDAKEAPELIKNLVADNQREIDAIGDVDPERAQGLAATVAGLLDQLIKLTKDPKDIYVYEQWRGDMLLRAGKIPEAEALWTNLRRQNDQDILNNIGEARTMLAKKEYAKAEDYFSRVLVKLPSDSDTFWEVYLRLIQAREAQGKNMDEVKRRLKDLKISSPAGFGGKAYKKQFDALADKYGI